MSWTDEEIDQLFRDRANDLSFEFKPEYWEDFSSSLSSMDLGGMSGETHEVDQLYQLSANELTFEYKDAYWKEVEGMLPRRRRPDFLWFGTALLFVGALTVASLTEEGPARVDSPVHSATHPASAPTSATSTTAAVENNTPAVVNEPGFTDKGFGAHGNPMDAQEMPILTEENLAEWNISENPGTPGENPQMPGVLTTDNEEPSGMPSDPDAQNPGLDLAGTPSDQNTSEPNVQVPGAQDATLEDHSVNTADREVGTLATRALPGMETQALAEASLPPDYDLKLPVSTGMYIELNGGLSQSLITPSSSLSYSGGLGLGARFTKGRFTFNTGVNGVIAFHDDIVLNRQAKVYSFGSEVYRYTLKYDQIYSVEGVLSAGYRFGAHQINLGVRPSYLIGTKVGVTMLEEDVETDRQTVYGHTEGLRKFGLKPMIGYSVDLRGNLTLGLNVGMQLMQQVEEDFINGKNNTLPLDAQIYIRKGLRFRK